MKKYKNFIITTLYIFLLDIVFSLLLFKYISLSNLFFYLLESITVSSIICFFSEIFKGKIKKIVLSLLLSFISILYIAQYVHYNFYDCFFSIYSLVNGGQVFGFMSAIIKEILCNIAGFLLLLLMLIGVIVIIIKTKNENNKKVKLILGIVLLINLLITSLSIYIPNTDNIYSRKKLLSNTNYETKDVESFGLATAMTIDFGRYISNTDYKLEIDNKDIDTNSKLYNISDIDFDSIETSDNDILMINKYLQNEEPTNKNDYTGIFKGKNLIFITAESFSFSIIDKVMTPTLYKLQTEGFSFNNFYTPIYYASTADGEYTNLTGLLPREGVWSYIASKDNYYPYNYANVFKDEGYSNYSYHNGEYNFYKRNEVMPNFGYSFKACGNGLEDKINCELWPQSDDEMLSKTFEEYKNSDKFHTYYMSISGHLMHSFKTNDMAKKHEKEVVNLNFHEATKAYLSANIDLDKALRHLLDSLEKEKLLDDTVIVLVPDHYPYGLSDKEYSDLRDLDTPYAKHKSGLIIYNSKIKGTSSDKYASNIDILPTLLNMFGVDFDSRLITGKDIMSDSKGIVIFNDRSFLTEEGFYNEKTNKFTKFSNNVSNDYIKNTQKIVQNKVNYSSLVLEKNYYEKIKSVIK